MLLSTRARGLRRSDVRDLLRQAQRPDMVSLAGGLPAAECFDLEGLRQATELAMREAPTACLQYGLTEGQPRLRIALAELMAARAMPVAPEAILVTSGSQQALDLVARALLDPGDRVALENPSYLAALQVFGLCDASLLAVPSDGDGAIVDALEALPAQTRPKLVYLVASFANPTGTCLPLERRLRLLRWAARHGVYLIEDDPYGALRYDGAAIPSLLALTAQVPEARPWCAYLSTLSKVVAPGLRIGWAVLPEPLASAAVRLKQAFDLHTATLPQEAAWRYLASGRLDQAVTRTRITYRKRRDALCGALAAAFGDSLRWQLPQGGMFVWARFTDGTDARALLASALDHGVTFVPGDAFHFDAADGATLRLNFSAAPPEALREGVARLAGAHAALWRQCGSRPQAVSA